MLTRAMILALGEDTAFLLRSSFISKRGETAADAHDQIAALLDDAIDGKSLMSLATTGKKLRILEQAKERMDVLIENFDNGGKPPRQKKDDCTDPNDYDEPWMGRAGG